MKRNIIGFCVLCCSILSCVGGKSEAPDLQIEKAADGFQFTEGPVWVQGKGLLFSDIPANKVYLYVPGQGTSVYLENSGNSNGLALDGSGKLLLVQHGLRQVSRLNDEGGFEALAAAYEGQKLNSPNDLAVHSKGAVFFTDPPFGLMDSGKKSETGFAGVYRIDPDGTLVLLDKELGLPNGIAFSPDEKTLYVNDSQKRIVYSWNVNDDLSVSGKSEFARIAAVGYADGMKTDSEGNLYVTGPGGVWMFSSAGELIRHISIPGQNSASNCAWGDDDGKTLYVTANYAVYRIRF